MRLLRYHQTFGCVGLVWTCVEPYIHVADALMQQQYYHQRWQWLRPRSRVKRKAKNGGTLQIDEIPIHKVPFSFILPHDDAGIESNHRDGEPTLSEARQESSDQPNLVVEPDQTPFCYAVSSIMDLPSATNFLATQVWPSARVAAESIERYADRAWTICELGCGPGLPSIASARLGHAAVIATDLDAFCLRLVQRAAQDQRLIVQTRRVDLTWEVDEFVTNTQEWCDTVDLFVLSDVFENHAVATGAARITAHLLSQQQNSQEGAKSDKHGDRPKVWVFAQSDRAQREVFLQEMRMLLCDDTLAWSPMLDGPGRQGNLWLCDLEELQVRYS
mmetsp:Transcript_6694/g.18176  ORF Transcript_6694/g.18176 Transcript_6694/m.18176 type:complete len:331 (+) Transcript_6694:58-1050(+)